jgi:hypothetical protein
MCQGNRRILYERLEARTRAVRRLYRFGACVQQEEKLNTSAGCALLWRFTRAGNLLAFRQKQISQVRGEDRRSPVNRVDL